MVARFHGEYGDKTALILPDGQLGFAESARPNRRAVPAAHGRSVANRADEMVPSPNINLMKTDHYLIFYKSTPGLRTRQRAAAR